MYNFSDWSLKKLGGSKDCGLYEAVDPSSRSSVRKLIATTPETRAICNDPFVAGIRYTRALQTACTKSLKVLKELSLLSLEEQGTIVLNILRGGLNFCLRDAVADAFNFNYHASAFVSAQRIRRGENSSEWIITEDGYQKLAMHENNHIIFGDVVATGTSLQHGLRRLLDSALDHGAQISGITFFTIGSQRSHEVLEEAHELYRSKFKSFEGATVVYLEGIFQMATFNTPMRIKLDGTDLIRAEALTAPEFVESQYESPAFPLERCTIYDAGSRAFDLIEYFEDVEDYWNQTLQIARKGITYRELLKERFPELDTQRYGSVNLEEVCRTQLSKLPEFVQR